MSRRSRAALGDDDDEAGPSASRRRSNTSGNVSNAASEDETGGNSSYSSEDQMVKKLVRLALAHEVSRRPIRRSDVSEKVLGNSSRAFKKVFDEANKQLQKVFGMTMSELPSKEKVSLQQKKQAQRSGQSQGTSSNNNKAYIVTTLLPPEYRRPEILPPVKTPSAELESQYVGLYSFIISVIMLSSSKRISDNKLDGILSKMNAGDTVAGDRTDRIIKRMEREGYITKVKEREGGEETIDYIVGPRGKMEVGETGVAGMVREVYGSRGDELMVLENRLETTLGKNTFERKTQEGTVAVRTDGDEEPEDNGEGPASAPATRQSTRRSQAAAGEEEDGDEEEEEEEEEDEDDEDE